MKKILIILLLLVSIVFYLFFIFYILKIETEKAFSLIKSLNITFLILALVSDILFILFYAFSFFFLVRIFRKIGFSEIFKASIFAWFVNMILPLGLFSGDVARIIYLKKKTKMKYSELIFLTTIHRILSFYMFIAYFLPSFVYFTIKFQKIYYNELIFALLLVFLSFIPFLIFFKERILIKILRILQRRGYKKIEKIEKMVKNIRKNKKLIIFSFIILLIHWYFGMLIPFLIFLSANCSINFFLLVFSYCVYGLLDNIPLIIPSNIGVLDAGMITSFMLIGVEKNLATVVTLITRFITVTFELILTGFLSYFFGIKEMWKYIKPNKKLKV